MATPDAAKRQRVDQEGSAPSASSGISVQEAMPTYYAKLFPTHHMYKWLSYGNDSRHGQADPHFFTRREFCFTLDGDIFVRYQAFKDGAALAEALQRRCPAKIDIGPVYSANPQDRHKFGASFQPLERELVFDIDLTDYDDVRTCGKGGHICAKCWPLMAVAVKIIDAGLRQEFGFKHILWVYSGRRGVHCWVCDPSARQLTDEQRSAVASWFAVYKGHEEGKARIALLGGAQHPAVERAATILRDAWVQTLLPAQRLLEDGPTCEALLRYLPEDSSGGSVADAVRKRWAEAARAAARSGAPAGDVSATRWEQLAEVVRNTLADERGRNAKNFKVLGPLERCLDEIIMAHAYPRLDMEVSKKMNHLLKAPFCVHPKTGKVCVPLDPAAADDFDPDGREVPTVAELVAELAEAAKQRQQQQQAGADADGGADQGPGKAGGSTPPPAAAGGGGGGTEPWRGTRMAAAVRTFERCLLDGLTATNREELAGKARVAVAVGQLSMDF